ncbi:AAA family ATPase [Methanohalophilus sp.]|uniref:AAA family ATPase n=1 Tax=Methanohalophilus sp. TaxID=1966352 RepID=UPI0026335149|nr:AAA family ATPase [Methanohalophilus sp.]MDK2891749.1 repair protein SbcC/Rad50 [Methanohalophilus sp.]
MKIKRLHIKNIRSYEDMEIGFDDGVTVVSGINGSGKSSLLEACFIGLFGSRGIPKNFVLSDMIRKGCEDASIVIEFEHLGHNYKITQQFRNNPKTGKASTSLSSMEMEGKLIADQVNLTYDNIRALLRMDEEAYRNCVYVRQGEIDVLINAKPKERQRMIDDLLQIGKLEEYRERAKGARTGLRRHITEAKARIQDHKEEIEKIEKLSPVKQLNLLKEKIGRFDLELNNMREKRERAKSAIDQIQKQIESYAELEQQKNELMDEIQILQKQKIAALKAESEYRAQILELEKSCQELSVEIGSLQKELGIERISDIEILLEKANEEERKAYNAIESLKADEKATLMRQQTAKQQIETMEQRQREISVKLSRLQDQIDEQEKSLSNTKKQISKLQEEIAGIYSQLEEIGFDRKKTENLDEINDLIINRRQQFHGKSVELETKITRLTEQIAKNRTLIEKGFCPTCGQDMHGSPINETTAAEEKELEKLKKQLMEVQAEEKKILNKVELVNLAKRHRDKIEELQHQIQLAENQLATSKTTIGDYRSQIEEEKHEREIIQEQLEKSGRDLDDLEKQLDLLSIEKEKAKLQHKVFENKLKQMNKLSRHNLDYREMKAEIKHLHERENEQQEKAGLLEKQILSLKKRADELKVKLGENDPAKLQQNLHKLEMAYTGLSGEIETIRKQKDEALIEMGQVETAIKRQKELKNKLRIFFNKKRYLDDVYKEAEDLEEMYLRLRADLRARNIEALSRLLNEIFAFMYTNNAYSLIQLDSDYELTVYEKDGTPLEPKLLSGGERAIFNLVLRCAIYRLLSRGLDGGVYNNEMPPLILDEPTVFLDRGHVHQLIKLIDLMRDTGAGQIIIVSHNETLIDSADNVFSVEKDPTTNISTISSF